MIPIIMLFMYPLVMLAVALMRLGIYLAIIAIAFLIRAAISLAGEAAYSFRRWRFNRRLRALSGPASWRSRPETLRFKLMSCYCGVVWKLRAPVRWWRARQRRAMSGNAASASAQRRSGR